MADIGVIDQTGETGAVAVNVAHSYRSMSSVEKEYNVQSVTQTILTSPKRKLCTATFGSTDTIVSASTPDIGNMNLIIEDGVPQLVFIPYIDSDETVFPESIRIALFDVDTGTINSTVQYVGSKESAKTWHESGERCYYEPVIFDNIFMTNTLQIKIILGSAPGASLFMNIGAFVGGDAIYAGGGGE